MTFELVEATIVVVTQTDQTISKFQDNIQNNSAEEIRTRIKMKPKLERSPNFMIKDSRSYGCSSLIHNNNYVFPDNEPKKVLQTKDGIYEGNTNEFGQRHGFGIMKYNWGDIYDGEWKNDIKQGVGAFFFTDKSFYSGEWRKGAYHGAGIHRDKHGNTFEGCWHNGLREGNGIFYYSDGRSEVNIFHANFPTGQGFRFAADGSTAWALNDGYVGKEISIKKALKLTLSSNLKVPHELKYPERTKPHPKTLSIAHTRKVFHGRRRGSC